MHRYSTVEKSSLLEFYFRTSSYIEARNLFAQRFPDVPIPCDSTVWHIVEKFRQTGTVQNVVRHRSPSVLTDETLTEIQRDILENPNISIRKLSQQMDVPKTTVHKALRKHLGLFPYRATVTHQLQPGDPEARKFFVSGFLTSVITMLIS